MIVAKLNSNKRRRIFCIIVVLVAPISLFAWHLVLTTEQQNWLITWLKTVPKSDNYGGSDLKSLGKHNGSHSKYNLYTNLKNSLSRRQNHSRTPVGIVGTKLFQYEPFTRKVLIISIGRSGSSFLGDLFNQNEKTFYLFEPLRWSNRDPSIYQSKKYKVLNDLYSCKFAEKVYLDFLIKERSFRRKSRKLSTFPGQCNKLSKRSLPCLSKILKTSCLRASSLVAKVLTHRLPQGGIWGIRKMLDTNKNLSIVHLIRDPRRVIASMKKAGWLKRWKFSKQVEYVCSTVWNNIQHVRNESAYYKARYKLLLFNDMMLDPFSTVVELYEFLKMGPVPDYIFSWIKQNTMSSVGDKKSQRTYGTFRNSTEVLNRKVDFSAEEERVIDTHCSNVIRYIHMIRKNSIN